MKLILVLLALAVAVMARPQKEQPVEIRSYSSDYQGRGAYNFQYELSDGSSRQETGELKNEGTEDEIQVVRGFYSFVGPDGQTYRVEYVADENGFQPQGAHLVRRR